MFLSLLTPHHLFDVAELASRSVSLSCVFGFVVFLRFGCVLCLVWCLFAVSFFSDCDGFGYVWVLASSSF